MKYKGITIHKNEKCETWYTRFRKSGKQVYISARTQKECYNLLKKKLAENIQQEDKKETYTFIQWYNNPDKYTKQLIEKTKIKFSIKYMRYTFITRCQEQNIPEFIIQAWFGHKIGSKVTKTVYTKYNEEDNKKYIDIINR